MNRARLSAIAIAFAALSAGQAMAQVIVFNGENYPADVLSQTSTVSRADVVASVLEAQKAGTLAKSIEVELPAQAVAQTSVKTRAEVRAELAQAQRAGTLVPYTGA